MSVNFSNDKKPLTTFSMAGLTDIVLLLLIFFLLTSTFIPQFGIKVNLPRVDTAAPTEAQYVTVAITEQGRYYVERDPVNAEDLLSTIERIRGDKATVVIRSDQTATVGQLAQVMTVAKALNMNILMATSRDDLRPR